jgi:hypothetical protein
MANENLRHVIGRKAENSDMVDEVAVVRLNYEQIGRLRKRDGAKETDHE